MYKETGCCCCFYYREREREKKTGTVRVLYTPFSARCLGSIQVSDYILTGACFQQNQREVSVGHAGIFIPFL